MDSIRKKLALNATGIKIIAIVLMVLDHIHQMFAPVGAPLQLTWFGRPVFILFLFAAADSWHYTKNRKKYILRLLCGSWTVSILSAILSRVLPNKDIVLMNNAFSTFFVTAVYMLSFDIFADAIRNKNLRRSAELHFCSPIELHSGFSTPCPAAVPRTQTKACAEGIKPYGSNKNTLKIIGAIGLFIAPILIGIPFLMAVNIEFSSQIVRQIVFTLPLFIPNIIFIEGGAGMVFIGLLFYVFRKRHLAQIAVLAAFSVLTFVLNKDSVQWMMIFAAIPMALYNGEKGRGMKYFFYIFYPAHIYILYIIAVLLGCRYF
ncbi:MAG: TraX family protein [Termitinemataceae bacterium]|nr:MAG: TraX family protein [Termitinemataceae bacterium]